MTTRLGSVVINCADLDTMTTFWSAALGLTADAGSADDRFRVLRGPHVNVSLQVAGTPVTARDQMHVDLYTDDQAEEVRVDDTLSKALRNDSNLTDTRAHDALGEALMGLTEPEIRRRLGPNPSQSDWQRVASQVMAEMAESGEFEKLLGAMGVRPSGYHDGA